LFRIAWNVAAVAVAVTAEQVVRVAAGRRVAAVERKQVLQIV
jgi:hypothetical protein